MVLFEGDLVAIDAFYEAARTHGIRNVNQSQAIRALLRSGNFDATILDGVIAEDRRRKSK